MNPFMPRSRTVWLLFDVSNGDKYSKRYLWWFDTREEARVHRKAQMSNDANARLSRPYKAVVNW